ncbi:MAG: hypothetical protein ACKPH4_29505 [Microcystis panniformis]
MRGHFQLSVISYQLSDAPLIKGGSPRLPAPPLSRGAGGIEPKIYLQFNYNQLLISYQLSVISYQLSVISYQLSVISYQLSVISYQI